MSTTLPSLAARNRCNVARSRCNKVAMDATRALTWFIAATGKSQG
jgi:hypothetical protein